MPRRTAEEAAATRAALVAKARQLFGNHGFATVGTDQLVRELGLTRGAIYHHFRTKEELFCAVLEGLRTELAEAVLARTADAPLESWAHVRAALHAYLDLCIDPVASRILLIEAPAALGWHRWAKFDEGLVFGTLVTRLEALIDAGDLLPGLSAVTLAHAILGALNRIGLTSAFLPRASPTHTEAAALLDQVIAALAAGSEGGGPES